MNTHTVDEVNVLKNLYINSIQLGSHESFNCQATLVYGRGGEQRGKRRGRGKGTEGMDCPIGWPAALVAGQVEWLLLPPSIDQRSAPNNTKLRTKTYIALSSCVLLSLSIYSLDLVGIVFPSADDTHVQTNCTNVIY